MALPQMALHDKTLRPIYIYSMGFETEPLQMTLVTVLTMPLPGIPTLRSLVHSRCAIGSERESLSVELTKELQEFRKISLNLLMAFLAVHAISASNALGAVTLALLIYTISLHIAMSGSFLQDSLALSRFLHAIPLVGIFSMAAIELVLVVRSPVLAAGVLLMCVLPPLIIGIQYAGLYADKMLLRLPARMQEIGRTAADATALPECI
ncbi:hypothetical protein BS17DRAFT_138780 [Gyrodon lividus]|nr:hypothetical protein BS17DRAFT_138780 [Gyrodon lividus]